MFVLWSIVAFHEAVDRNVYHGALLPPSYLEKSCWRGDGPERPKLSPEAWDCVMGRRWEIPEKFWLDESSKFIHPSG